MMSDTPITPDNAPSFAELYVLLAKNAAADEARRKADEARWAKAEKRQAEMDKMFAELVAARKSMESRWARFVESLVAGDLIAALNGWGVQISDTSIRQSGRRPNGQQYEFDILAHNGEEVVVVEVKTTLRPDDVKEFLEKLEQFKTWVPLYAGKVIYGAMAYISTDAQAQVMAEKRGLFTIRATGDSASIVNAEGFKPRAF